MKFHLSFMALAVILSLFFISCMNSAGEVSDITAPDTNQSLNAQKVEQETTKENLNNRYLWGYYTVYINPDDLTWEIIPNRTVNPHFSAMNDKWFNYQNTDTIPSIEGIKFIGINDLLVDFTIPHPLASKNFSGFDVRGILMFDGSLTFPEAGVKTSNRFLGEGEVLNPDGYTTLFNPTTEGQGPMGLHGFNKSPYSTQVLPTSTLNPFKRFITPEISNTRHAFYGGDKRTVSYEIRMPSGQFRFGLAIDASWAPPTKSPVTNPSADFPPEANCPEPWALDVKVEPVGIGLTPYGGKVNISLEVYDYQGKDSFKTPTLECPSLMTGTIPFEPVSTPPGPSVRFTLVGTSFGTGAQPGNHKALIKVEDKDNDSSPSYLDLTAYQIVEIEVNEFSDEPPMALAKADSLPGTICEPVNFSDDGSFDPDGGSIVKYEWDWNNDGVWDEEGKSVSHSWDTPGTYPVRFRVTDDEGSTTSLAPPMNVEIKNGLPFAIAKASKYSIEPNETVDFSGIDSYDTDCDQKSIVSWEWDWDNNGTYDDTGANVSHKFTLPGNYLVQLRVTDNEGGTDTLDAPLSISVGNSGWALGIGSYSSDTGNSIGTDKFGNIYVSGSYDGYTDFDPGPGEDYHEGYGIGDSFVAKFDNKGNYIWARTWGGSNINVAYTLAVADDGSLYVGGFFTGTVDFDPGPVNVTRISGGGNDAYLSYFDASGNFKWVRTWGGSSTDTVTNIRILSNGDAVACGLFMGTLVDFDPGLGSDIKSSIDSTDSYLVRYDTNGNYKWGQVWGHLNHDRAYGLAIDGSDNVIVSGFFHESIDLDPGPGEEIVFSNGSSGIFTSKFNSSGTRQWSRIWDSDSDDSSYAVAAFPSGSIFVTGSYGNTIDLDPGSGVSMAPIINNIDAFIVKLNSAGVFQWGKYFGGKDLDYILACHANPNGDLLVSGRFEDTDMDFDPGPGVWTRGSNGGIEAFVSKFNASGDFLWANTYGSTSTDVSYGITTDIFGNVITSGVFMGTVDFDPGPGNFKLTSVANTQDICIVKYKSDGYF